MKDATYYFHQTPSDLAKRLIDITPLESGQTVLEPFRGEGAFYNAFPENVVKKYTELEEGLDYKTDTGETDWVITNPPFQIDVGTKRANAFFVLLMYFLDKAKVGVAFLANPNCFGTLTPKRLAEIREKGWYIQTITVVSVKAWRGRYYYIIFQKKPQHFYTGILGNF